MSSKDHAHSLKRWLPREANKSKDHRTSARSDRSDRIVSHSYARNTKMSRYSFRKKDKFTLHSYFIVVISSADEVRFSVALVCLFICFSDC